jgi:hypothetical protein
VRAAGKPGLARHDLWRRLQPRPATGYSRRRIRAAIKARLRYVRKTETIRAAAASLN